MKLRGFPTTGRFLIATLLAPAVLFSYRSSGCPVASHGGCLDSRASYEPGLIGLRHGLKKLGYHENREIKFIVEDTRASLDKLSECAKRLVAAKPEALFTIATAPSLAAKQETQTIPIVFAIVGDPVQTGLVAGFGSSKNNVTGVVTFGAQLMGKRLEVLKAIAPQIKSVGDRSGQ